MEKSPFDLNRAIQLWREDLSQSPVFRRENLNELESHLRDSVATLQTRDLSAQEAFEVAVGRIGKDGTLETEFGKLNVKAVWLDRMLWMLIGIQVWGLVSGLMSSISHSAVSVGLIFGHFDFAAHGQTLPVILFMLVRLLAIAGSLALCWWLIVRKGQIFSSRIQRSLDRRVTLAAICGALCMISLSGHSLGFGSYLLWKLADPRTVSQAAVSMGYSHLFGGVVQAFTLIALTLILARKRLRLSKT